MADLAQTQQLRAIAKNLEFFSKSAVHNGSERQMLIDIMVALAGICNAMALDYERRG